MSYTSTNSLAYCWFWTRSWLWLWHIWSPRSNSWNRRLIFLSRCSLLDGERWTISACIVGVDRFFDDFFDLLSSDSQSDEWGTQDISEDSDSSWRFFTARNRAQYFTFESIFRALILSQSCFFRGSHSSLKRWYFLNHK